MGLSNGVFLDDLRELSTRPANASAEIIRNKQHGPDRPADASLKSASPTSAAVVLDPKRIAATRSDTRQVSIILGDIFAPEDVEETTDLRETTSARYKGLDRSYETMADELLARPTWSPKDLEELAKRNGLMADGAMEEINEWAYGQFDEPVLEKDDQAIQVNQRIVEKLKSDSRRATHGANDD